MVSDRSERTHTVQGSGNSSESYSVTVLQEWGKEFVGEDVQHRKAGEYLITWPTQAKNQQRESTLTFDANLEQKNKDELETYIENLIQSYCIAGVDRVHLDLPSTWDADFIQEIEQILRTIGRVTGIDYNPESDTITFDQRVDFEAFTNKVANFVGMYLFAPLTDLSSEPAGMLHDEARIDIHWAFAARVAGEAFLECNREAFPREMCSLYIAKYLEEIVDEVKKIGLRLDNLENPPTVLQDLTAELSEIYRGELLSKDQVALPAYESQIRHVSKESRNLALNADDFAEQYRIFMTRKDALTAWRETAVNRLSDHPGVNQVELGILLGELWRISERLFRIPVSMTLVGVGARRVGLVHDIESS